MNPNRKTLAREENPARWISTSSSDSGELYDAGKHFSVDFHRSLRDWSQSIFGLASSESEKFGVYRHALLLGQFRSIFYDFESLFIHGVALPPIGSEPGSFEQNLTNTHSAQYQTDLDSSLERFEDEIQQWSTFVSGVFSSRPIVTQPQSANLRGALDALDHIDEQLSEGDNYPSSELKAFARRLIYRVFEHTDFPTRVYAMPEGTILIRVSSNRTSRVFVQLNVDDSVYCSIKTEHKNDRRELESRELLFSENLDEWLSYLRRHDEKDAA